MKFHLTIVVGFVIVVGSFVMGILGADEKSPDDHNESDPATLMEDKLRHTHALLTSLAQEDFSALQKSAQKLQRVARQQWTSNPSPEYRAQLQIFWTTLQGIESGAERKEVEESALAYMQMTLACVKCHKIVRRERRRS